MKRISMVFGACALAGVIAVGGVLAAGGAAGDPVISLNYLTGTFLPQLLKQPGDKVEAG